MDETQRRKNNTRLDVKGFLREHKKMSFSVAIIFLSLFIIYSAFLIFYSPLNELSAVSQNQNEEQNDTTFFERLFPTFEEKENQNVLDENGLPIIRNSSTTLADFTEGENVTGDSLEADSVIIEKDPVLDYVVFDKAVSIKKYIKNKPKLCLEKISKVEKKDEKGKAVENFQNTLKSMEGFDTQEVTGVLDEKTRENLFILQKRYAEILYKNKSNKEPTRLIDKETTHFINLLCGFDKESSDINSGDFVFIPTLRYVKKATNEIFDYNTITKELVSLNNKLATGTELASFSPSGDYIAFRKEGVGQNRGQIMTEVLSLKNNNRVNLERNIHTLDFNKNNILLYGVSNNLSMSIKTYDPVKQEISKLAEIPMREWNVFWLGDGTSGEIGIYNKPSAFAEGIYMTLNVNTRKIERKSGPQLGFSVTPTNFSEFSIASIGGAGNLSAILINNTNKNTGSLDIQTFAEKCAKEIVQDGIFCAVPKSFQNTVNYPDDWYKGKYLSDDSLIYKTISGTTTKTISTFNNKPVSIIQLKIHSSGIYFIDERTMSLYTIKI